ARRKKDSWHSLLSRFYYYVGSRGGGKKNKRRKKTYPGGRKRLNTLFPAMTPADGDAHQGKPMRRTSGSITDSSPPPRSIGSGSATSFFWTTICAPICRWSAKAYLRQFVFCSLTTPGSPWKRYSVKRKGLPPETIGTR